MTLTYPPVLGNPVSYTPVLKGATDDPSAATYTTQFGDYELAGKMCKVNIVIITTSITKTTTADAVRISLPFAAVNNAGQVQLLSSRATNSTPVQNSNLAYTTANQAYITLAQLPLTAAQVDITYGATSIGVLTNTITIQINGIYETV